ncbi:serine/threonine protein kinase [Scandinavium manionii]|uniref:serine/threonine protein kinase n=1 Tax=Scandinavium manionii TaxID=2926520 RepID=UPI00135C3A19|nr:serine/threonine-protein kinase [Scandinavium manionii]MCS2164505.1 serine/threonine protein kinase [Scandinavium manionii]
MTDHENNRTLLNALPIGYRFNEFEIKEVIGGGGFGIVYRAWDHQLERTIAIKEFMPSSLAVRGEGMRLALRSERFARAFSAGLNSFIQEARLLGRFNHPNLVHVLRFWVQNDTAYMVTLFYSGVTLSRLKEKQPELIDEAWIRRILPMLFGAIRIIHDEGYLHRDISPENIQIQDNGLPVLLDLGSARRTISTLSDETETMLRPGYAPIEQYTDDNESEQGAWTDIYAIGAVLHTLIMGTPPPVSVVRSIQDNYLPLAERQPAGYSLSLLQAVDKALSLKVEDRPQSIDEFAELIRMPITNIHDTRMVKNPGSMVALPAEEEPPKVNDWMRYKVPAMIAASVLVGALASGILFRGGNHTPSTTTTSMQQPALPGTLVPTPALVEQTPVQQTPPVVKENTPVPAEAEPITDVYVRIHEGEKLKINGKSDNTASMLNGFALLKLAPGQYDIALESNGLARKQMLEIVKPGTWIINPSY